MTFLKELREHSPRFVGKSSEVRTALLRTVEFLAILYVAYTMKSMAGTLLAYSIVINYTYNLHI